MGLFDIFKRKNSPACDDCNNDPSLTVPHTDDGHSAVYDKWKSWREDLPKKLEKDIHIELYFLTEVLEVSPDGYAGTDRLYYYHDKMFYTRISHWDAGNMFSNRSGDISPMNKNQLTGVVKKAKRIDKSKVLPSEKEEFENIADDILEILLKQYD